MPARSRPHTCRLFGLVLVGILLVELGWALVVPPFRGSDEHEHVYKAAAVARGDFGPHHVAAALGWGEYLAVPRDLVTAAHPECTALQYTTAENCSPGQDLGNGDVTVASSAARYNPVYYAFVGTVARPFAGDAALYVMRGASALAVAILLSLALVVTRRNSRTPNPTLGVLLGVTPVVLYSASMVAPNGAELASGALLWSVGLALQRSVGTGDRVRHLVALGTLAASLLACLRTFGPIWLVLTLACLLLLDRAATRTLLTRRDVRIGGVIAGSATAYGVGWTLIAGSNAPPPGGQTTMSVWSGLAGNFLAWIFQSIAAFPIRNENAPTIVYVLVLIAIGGLAVKAMRLANKAETLVLLIVVAASSAVAIGATAMTFSSLGYAWQGRYGLPFSMGFILICGHLLDRPTAPRRRSTALAVGIGLTVVANLISQLDVLARESAHSPLAGSSAWLQPAPWAVVALLALAGGLLWSGLSELRPESIASRGELARGSRLGWQRPPGGIAAAGQGDPLPSAQHGREPDSVGLQRGPRDLADGGAQRSTLTDQPHLRDQAPASTPR